MFLEMGENPKFQSRIQSGSKCVDGEEKEFIRIRKSAAEFCRALFVMRRKESGEEIPSRQCRPLGITAGRGASPFILIGSAGRAVSVSSGKEKSLPLSRFFELSKNTLFSLWPGPETMGKPSVLPGFLASYCPPPALAVLVALAGGAFLTHLSNQFTISHRVCSVDSRAR
jgi:hypothetical protein